MQKIIFILLLIFTFELTAQQDSVVNYYNNGNTKSIIHLRDNFRDGDAKFFWENGNIKEELSYINGRVEGLVRKYNNYWHYQ